MKAFSLIRTHADTIYLVLAAIAFTAICTQQYYR